MYQDLFIHFVLRSSKLCFINMLHGSCCLWDQDALLKNSKALHKGKYLKKKQKTASLLVWQHFLFFFPQIKKKWFHKWKKSDNGFTMLNTQNCIVTTWCSGLASFIPIFPIVHVYVEEHRDYLKEATQVRKMRKKYKIVSLWFCLVQEGRKENAIRPSIFTSALLVKEGQETWQKY